MSGQSRVGVVSRGLLLAGAALWLAGCAAPPHREPPLTDEQVRLNVESFDYVWTTIRDKHFDPDLNGADWDAARAELRQQVEQARQMSAARNAISTLIGRLDQTHFGIVSADAYDSLAAGDDQPAPAGDPATSAPAVARDGSAGIDLYVVDGQALVTRVEPGSPGEQAGVRPGWVALEIDGLDVSKRLTAIAEALPDSTHLALSQTRSVLRRLTGPVGTRVKAVFLDGDGGRRETELELAEPRGKLVKLGNMPGNRVWFESRRLEGGVGYIAFNMFLDPGMIMTRFGEAMQEFKDAPGIVIDLRGNPGGLGAMAMGCAGWFVSERGRQLGVMKMRNNEIKFVVNPRARPFKGPLAVLVDGLSASTAEIMAGGLKDIGRARLFGSRTAGAALPSTFERLPNGDGFQYAFADYVSAGGERLEGVGVTPDEVIPWQREALLAGRDAALDAALHWIGGSVQRMQ